MAETAPDGLGLLHLVQRDACHALLAVLAQQHGLIGHCPHATPGAHDAADRIGLQNLVGLQCLAQAVDISGVQLLVGVGVVAFEKNFGQSRGLGEEVQPAHLVFLGERKDA